MKQLHEQQLHKIYTTLNLLNLGLLTSNMFSTPKET
jgi:hypothetical protein